MLLDRLDATDDDEPVPRAAKSPNKAGKANMPAPASPPPSSREEEAVVTAMETLKAAIGPFYSAYSLAATERVADAGGFEQAMRIVEQYCDMTKRLWRLWRHLRGTQSQLVVLRGEQERK